MFFRRRPASAAVPIEQSTGRVSATVGPDRLGEVMVSIRGGTEAFDARPYTPDEVILEGVRVIVMEFAPPRLVYVAPIP